MADLKDNPKRYRPHQNEYTRAYAEKNRDKLRDGRRESNRKYYAKNRELLKAKERERYKANDPDKRNERVRKRYAITGKSPAKAARDAALAKRHRANLELLATRPKPDKCDVCGTGGRIVFDHCHKQRHFRGWLCDGCNVALGMVGDDPKRLRMLAAYLERVGKEQGPQGHLPGI